MTSLRSNRYLKLLTSTMPVIVLGFLFYLGNRLSGEPINWPIQVAALSGIFIGSIGFTIWVFNIIEQREKEIQNRSNQLAALHEAALTLTMELDLGTVLQKVVDEARLLANSQYGALGVLSSDGETLEQFITSGITAEQRVGMGVPPQGHGLLGIMVKNGKSIRVPFIKDDHRAAGFPKNHPYMSSLLGVPIKSKGRLIGTLYLTNKLGSTNYFSERDQHILEMFATQAAIAIENAQLYRQTQQLAILQERERFGMALHDGVIQSIYAIGLMLEDTEHRLENEPKDAKKAINRSIHGLNDVIRDIRNYILNLRPQRFQGRDLWQGLEELVREFRANTFLDVSLDKNGANYANLTPAQTVEILHIAQEALTNVRKHARATQVIVNLHGQGSAILLTVEDNGVGISNQNIENAEGNGLYNMQERAHSLNGKVQFGPCDLGGTCVTLYVPVNNNARS